jgi:hypothetical protein
MSLAKPSTTPSLVKLALTGALAGGLVSIAGCHWLLWAHQEDQLAFCDETYEDCLEDAVNEADEQLCEDEVQSCYEACEAGWDDEQGGGWDDEGYEDDAGTTGAEGGDGDGDTEGTTDTGSGDGDGDTGEDPGVCIELFGNCIDAAETIQDVEACEVLYDHCVNPGECPEPECGCPAEALEACLSTYAECVALADTPEKVELCAQGFDTCTAPFADQCPVEENPNLDPCLEQHGLCVACADGELQVEACQDVFQACLNG